MAAMESDQRRQRIAIRFHETAPGQAWRLSTEIEQVCELCHRASGPILTFASLCVWLLRMLNQRTTSKS